MVFKFLTVSLFTAHNRKNIGRSRSRFRNNEIGMKFCAFIDRENG